MHEAGRSSRIKCTQGITSLKKYESDGGPTFADNYNLVKTHSSSPIPDLNQLLKWLIYNLVIGNNDSHSKNLAFLQTGDGIRIAPFYDLLCTSVYKEIGQNFAFRIGGQNLWFKLKRRLFDKLSAELGLKEDVLPKLALKLLSDIEKILPKNIQDLNKRFPDVKTASILEKEIIKRVAFFQNTFKENK